MINRDVYRTGRLSVHATTSLAKHEAANGIQKLQLQQKKECLLYVPRSYRPQVPAVFILTLHGAGGNAAHGLSYFQKYADEKNLILLAPASIDYSWDIIAADSFGPDVIFIDQALEHVFQQYSINLSRIGIGGFSDGASYALSLGSSNGDLFTHIIAFSPGFYYTHEKRGSPSVYISHGVNDNVLPVNPCSRRIVPKLKHEGFAVLYDEFNGRHEIPGRISTTALDWFLQQ